MIDLDRPNQPGTPWIGPAGRGRRRLTMILAVVGSLLAGVVVGGVTMDVWRYRPLQKSVEAERSTVAVLLFTGPDVLTVRNQDEQVRIETQVMVVNAGPEMISVNAVHVDQPDVTVSSPELERRVAPGTAYPVDVVVEWKCVAQPSAPLAASVTVETEDEQIRTISPVTLHGTPWTEARRSGCAGAS